MQVLLDPRWIHLPVGSPGARRLEHDVVTVAGAYALVGQDELLADTVVELAYLPIACDRFEDFVDSFVVPADAQTTRLVVDQLAASLR